MSAFTSTLEQGIAVVGQIPGAVGSFRDWYATAELAPEVRAVLDQFVADYVARVARTPKEIIALQKQSANRIQELKGFREAMLQAVEVDAIAHASPPVKAINAQRMAMRGDGKHRVSLDKVIKTMRDTGADMAEKYKETSRGGLAVNVIEC